MQYFIFCVVVLALAAPIILTGELPVIVQLIAGLF